jgi:hypothetical protein
MKHLILLLAFVVLCAAGCGERLPSGLPKVYPVSLIIVQEGTPLADATVSLIPKNTESSWSATGVTDASGKAEFYTQGKYKGVPADDYKIVVLKTFTEPSQYAGQGKPADVDYMEWQNKLGAEKLRSYNLVEEKYCDRSMTPLELHVDADGVKNKQIEAGKAVRIPLALPPKGM